MNKIGIIVLCLLFLGMSTAAAVAIPTINNQKISTSPMIELFSGTFEGVLGFRRAANATEVGTITGTYEMRQRGGRFTGEWTLTNDTRSGTVKGAFGRHLLIGRISSVINGTERSLPIIGFIRYQENEFLGRFMAPIGPALYFRGTYT